MGLLVSGGWEGEIGGGGRVGGWWEKKEEGKKRRGSRLCRQKSLWLLRGVVRRTETEHLIQPQKPKGDELIEFDNET